MNHPKARKPRTLVWILLALLIGSGVFAQLPKDAAADFRRALDDVRQGRHESALQVLDSLERRFPKAADVHHLKAIVLDLLGRAEEAGRQFRQAVELNPSSADMRTNYATSLLRQGRREEAAAEFRLALERSADHPTAHFNLGTLLLDQGRFSEALPHLQKAFSAQPEIYENGYQLARCLFLLEDYGGVERLLAQVGPAPAERLEFPLLQALTDRALGREELAAARLSALLPRLSQDPEARPLAIVLLLSRDLYAEALPLLESAVQDPSAASDDWMRLAYAHRALGNLQRAAEAALRANQLAESGDAHALLGDLMEELGRPLEAVDHLQRAVALDPSEDHFFALGYEFLAHWNWETAQRVLQEGVERHAGSWRLWLALGAALLGQNQIEPAADAFLKSLSRQPHPTAFQLLALCYDQAGSRQAEASRAFERHYRENPADARAAYHWALVNFRDVSSQGGPAESLSSARRILTEAIQRDPDSFDAYLLLGEIEGYRQDWDAAVSALSEAVARSPRHPLARYKLGLALQRSGRSEAARRELAEYQRLKQEQEQDVSERISQTRRFIVEWKP